MKSVEEMNREMRMLDKLEVLKMQREDRALVRWAYPRAAVAIIWIALIIYLGAL